MRDELKRLRLRSWRRGIKECDLILGTWADGALEGLDAGEIATYERLLSENDHDIYAWVAGSAPVPAEFAPLIARIAAESRPRPA